MKFTFSVPLLPLTSKIKYRHLRVTFKFFKPLPHIPVSMLHPYHTDSHRLLGMVHRMAPAKMPIP